MDLFSSSNGTKEENSSFGEREFLRLRELLDNEGKPSFLIKDQGSPTVDIKGLLAVARAVVKTNEKISILDEVMRASAAH